MIYMIRNGILKLGRRILELRARKNVMSNSALWPILKSYMEQTTSTGCQFIDYETLYNYVRRWKPQEILECGTGTSTIVIACALMENYKETGETGRVTSMEENEKWFDIAKGLTPEKLCEFVDLRLSETIESGYMIYRGMRYKDVPERPYDFVFIDGPLTSKTSDGTKSSDIDYLHIIRNSEIPVRGIIDCRFATCYVFQKILGVKKVKFDAYRNLGFIEPCTKDDLLVINKNTPRSLNASKRILRKTQFHLNMEPPVER